MRRWQHHDAAVLSGVDMPGPTSTYYMYYARPVHSLQELAGRLTRGGSCGSWAVVWTARCRWAARRPITCAPAWYRCGKVRWEK